MKATVVLEMLRETRPETVARHYRTGEVYTATPFFDWRGLTAGWRRTDWPVNRKTVPLVVRVMGLRGWAPGQPMALRPSSQRPRLGSPASALPHLTPGASRGGLPCPLAVLSAPRFGPIGEQGAPALSPQFRTPPDIPVAPRWEWERSGADGARVHAWRSTSGWVDSVRAPRSNTSTPIGRQASLTRKCGEW